MRDRVLVEVRYLVGKLVSLAAIACSLDCILEIAQRSWSNGFIAWVVKDW